jgi:hypothetical protein
MPDPNQEKGRTKPETAVRRRLLLKARQTILFYGCDLSYKEHSKLEAGHNSDYLHELHAPSPEALLEDVEATLLAMVRPA